MDALKEDMVAAGVSEEDAGTRGVWREIFRCGSSCMEKRKEKKKRKEEDGSCFSIRLTTRNSTTPVPYDAQETRTALITFEAFRNHSASPGEAQCSIG